MKPKHLFFICLLLLVEQTIGQTNTFPVTGSAGIGTLTPNASSLLEIQSTTKGLLIPRMTQAKRDLIVSPATGLMIYQTNSTPGFYYYSGSAWVAVSPKGVNKSLSNLTAPTAINQSLFPGITNSIDLGSFALQWKDAYISGDAWIYGRINGIAVGIGSTDGLGAGNQYTSTAIGRGALYSNGSGFYNTANGFEALYSNYSGSYNTAIGFQALHSSWDNGNTAVGAYALYNNTGYWNTALGEFADASGGDAQRNATAIGFGAIVDSWNKVRVGNDEVTSIGGHVGWTTFSDGRYKKNIKEDVKGLAFINSLKPITYTVDINGLNTYYDKNRKHNDAYEKVKKDMQPSADEGAKIVYNGFIAQDVEAAAKKLNYNFSGVDKPKTDDGLYGLRYADFVVPLVKAVQELSKTNDAKDTRIDDLQKRNDLQQKQIDELKTMMQTLQQSFNNCNSSAGNSSVQQSAKITTDGVVLEQNVPNPFTRTTNISYTLPQKFTTAQIMITDKNGKTLKLVTVSGSGKGKINVDASTLAAGAYNYSLLVDGKLVGTKQMVLTK